MTSSPFGLLFPTMKTSRIQELKDLREKLSLRDETDPKFNQIQRIIEKINDRVGEEIEVSDFDLQIFLNDEDDFDYAGYSKGYQDDIF